MGGASLVLYREGVQDLGISVKLLSSCSALQAEGVALRSALTYTMEHSESHDSFEIC